MRVNTFVIIFKLKLYNLFGVGWVVLSHKTLLLIYISVQILRIREYLIFILLMVISASFNLNVLCMRLGVKTPPK